MLQLCYKHTFPFTLSGAPSDEPEHMRAFAVTSYFYLMFVLFFQIIIINFVAE